MERRADSPVHCCGTGKKKEGEGGHGGEKSWISEGVEKFIFKSSEMAVTVEHL